MKCSKTKHNSLRYACTRDTAVSKIHKVSVLRKFLMNADWLSLQWHLKGKKRNDHTVTCSPWPLSFRLNSANWFPSLSFHSVPKKNVLGLAHHMIWFLWELCSLVVQSALAGQGIGVADWVKEGNGRSECVQKGKDWERQ